MTPKAVIFDCDGVVMDSEGISFALLAEQLALHGLPMSHAEIARNFLGGTIRSFWEGARAQGASLPYDWVAAQYQRMFDRLRQGVDLVPGVLGVLDALDAAGLPYAIGSNGPVQKMEIMFAHHPGLWQRFGGRVFSSQTLGAPKPAPDVYLFAARAMGVAPSDCVVIEDSAAGLHAAKAAGMRRFGFDADGDGAALAAVGATVFHRMDDLPGLLGLGPKVKPR
jgi:HAD superfamily hydrolase (TIGR01509 family)